MLIIPTTFASRHRSVFSDQMLQTEGISTGRRKFERITKLPGWRSIPSPNIRIHAIASWLSGTIFIPESEVFRHKISQAYI